jgi:protein-tyrosine phosphatase
MKVLMVCLGNICRSPLAEGILASKVAQLGLNWEVDSAGTGDWHTGQAPDKRSIAIGKQYGVNIGDQQARQIKRHDFDRFDLIYVMDKSNLRNVLALAPNAAAAAKVRLIMDETQHALSEVPDPYYDDNGFEQVFQMLDQACDGIINTAGQ